MSNAQIAAFRIMARANSPETLLSGLIGAQLGTFLAGLQPEAERVLQRSCQAAERSLLEACSGLFASVIDGLEHDRPAEHLWRLPLLRIDRAAYELLLGRVESFSELVVKAFENAYDEYDLDAVYTAVDFSWPLFWYRLRKFPITNKHDVTDLGRHVMAVGMASSTPLPPMAFGYADVREALSSASYLAEMPRVNRMRLEMREGFEVTRRTFVVFERIWRAAEERGLEPGPGLLRDDAVRDAVLTWSAEIDGEFADELGPLWGFLPIMTEFYAVPY